jgi:hypothetical protein
MIPVEQVSWKQTPQHVTHRPSLLLWKGEDSNPLSYLNPKTTFGTATAHCTLRKPKTFTQGGQLASRELLLSSVASLFQFQGQPKTLNNESKQSDRANTAFAVFPPHPPSKKRAFSNFFCILVYILYWV